MGEDSKAPAMTIRIPPPRVLAEAAARSPDARTGEVLRALHRAKRIIAGSAVSPSSPSTEALVWELRALRDSLSKSSPVVEGAAQRLTSSAAVLERVVVLPSAKHAELQRSQESVLRELRDAVHALKRQADVLTWRAWSTRRLATFSLVLALLLAGGIGLAWRAHALAKSTHQILAQILENQERAQAAKAGKRR